MDSAGEGSTIRKPFIDHVRELQKRLIWAFLAVLGGAGIAHSISGQLLDFVQKPLGEHLYYTSPMGGFTALFKLCLAMGLVIALPIILYNLFRFLQPLLERGQLKVILAYTFVSMVLAYSGVAFAYYVSLPSSLHFLSQFGEGSFESIITADEYFNFALTYIAGFALLFQLPLIVMFINRINPLSPLKMMKAQRYVIVGSFIIAAILTPTPDPINQSLMAFPAILLYQASVVLVWVVNKKRHTTKVRSFKKSSEIAPSLQVASSLNHFKEAKNGTQSIPARPSINPRHKPVKVLARVERPNTTRSLHRRPVKRTNNHLVMDMVVAQRH